MLTLITHLSYTLSLIWRDKCLQLAASSNVFMILLQASTGKSSESGDGKDASIQDCRDEDTKKPEEDELHYASITIQNTATEDK